MSRTVNGIQVLAQKGLASNRGIQAHPASDPGKEDAVSQQLVASGEKDRLKAVLRQRLAECGWTEDVTRHAREVVAKSKDAPPTADEIADAVRQRGRQRVPDQIKAELLTELRTIILQR
mmetsp:Transcript_20718/g.62429  ORF Transcript_20718/g.62429 Transcript_20718/m.62429 type:complete len:119 (+) Transcript_20718:446-802(+)